MIALERVAAPDPLHIHFARGQSDRLVVSFAGVGRKRHIPPEPEFARMTTSIARSNVLFITDASRSWMNGPGVATSIQRVVEETADQIAAGDIVAMGNSMGGSQAMVLAGMMRVNRVLAIVPQYSVKSDVIPEESRWAFYRNRIVQWPHPKVPDLRERDCLVTLLHGGTPSEWRHASRFPTDAGYRHFIFPERRHTLARELHKQGQLRPIVQAIIEGRPRRAREAIEAAGGMLRADFEARDLTLSPKEAGHDEI